jgi:hypothetical protein
MRHKQRSGPTHPQDSHTYLDPYEVWCRVMRVKIGKESWDYLQRGHFTYWYMPTR